MFLRLRGINASVWLKERRWMWDGKWCPEEKKPTEILLPSSLPPTGNCDGGSAEKCCKKKKKRTFSSLRHQYWTLFLSKTQNEKKLPTSYCLALFVLYQKVPFVATLHEVKEFSIQFNSFIFLLELRRQNGSSASYTTLAHCSVMSPLLIHWILIFIYLFRHLSWETGTLKPTCCILPGTIPFGTIYTHAFVVF